MTCKDKFANNNLKIANGLQRTIEESKVLLLKHGPKVLVGLGIAGMITSVGMAISATTHAIDTIEKEKDQKKEDLTKKEILKVTWKYYVPTVGMIILSTGLLVGTFYDRERKYAALTAAYSLSESTLKDYQSRIVSELGEEREKEIRNAVKNDQAMFINDDQCVLFSEDYSGLEFRRTLRQMNEFEKNVNRYYNDASHPVTLNDIYDEIGLEKRPYGDDYGWSSLYNTYIEFDYEPAINNRGEPCLNLMFSPEPVKLY